MGNKEISYRLNISEHTVKFHVNSILNRDRTLILGTVMVYSVFLLVFNLLVDIAYSFVDPRIDLEKAN